MSSLAKEPLDSVGNEFGLACNWINTREDIIEEGRIRRRFLLEEKQLEIETLMAR